MRKGKKKLYKCLLTVSCVMVAGVALLWGIQTYVKERAAGHILSMAEAEQMSDFDCILVLGCKVKENGVPSDMLADRLAMGVALQQAGVSEKLLMSGDHGQEEYNEVAVMKQYAIEKGVASEDVFMDHAGFSTYDSVYRAKEIFEAKKILIVTQEYHLYRALYVAEELGMEAYGVSADTRTYFGQAKRDVREVLARVKDFFMVCVQAQPVYLGEVIPLSGNGDVTND